MDRATKRAANSPYLSKFVFYWETLTTGKYSRTSLRHARFNQTHISLTLLAPQQMVNHNRCANAFASIRTFIKLPLYEFYDGYFDRSPLILLVVILWMPFINISPCGSEGRGRHNLGAGVQHDCRL